MCEKRFDIIENKLYILIALTILLYGGVYHVSLPTTLAGAGGSIATLKSLSVFKIVW